MMWLKPAAALVQEFTFTLTGGDGNKLHAFCRLVLWYLQQMLVFF